MASTDPVEKITQVNNMYNLAGEAYKVIDDLKEVSELLSMYNITALSEYDITKVIGARLGFGSEEKALPAGAMPLGQAVFTIKKKIAIIQSKHKNSFPKEMSYLTPEKLTKFKCLSAEGLLGDTDLVDGVNKSLEAMYTRLDEIIKKKEEIYQMATQSPIHDKALSSFYSLANSSILDSYTKEDQLIRDFERDRKVQADENKKDMARLVEASLYDSASPPSTPLGLNTVAMGLSPVPVDPISKAVSDFSMWLVSAQAPKSANFCIKRTPLNKSSLTASRANGAENGAGVNQAAAKRGKNEENLGKKYLASPEYLGTIKGRFDKAIGKFAVEGKDVPYRRQFESLQRSLGACSTEEGVKTYINEFQKLFQRMGA